MLRITNGQPVTEIPQNSTRYTSVIKVRYSQTHFGVQIWYQFVSLSANANIIMSSCSGCELCSPATQASPLQLFLMQLFKSIKKRF